MQHFLSVELESVVTISGLLQIAPAEAPDAKVRMVIITGPPEAQFKVCALECVRRWQMNAFLSETRQPGFSLK